MVCDYYMCYNTIINVAGWHYIICVGMYVNHEFTIAVITMIFALYRDFRRLP